MKLKTFISALVVAYGVSSSSGADAAEWERRLGPAASEQRGSQVEHPVTPAISFSQGPARVNPYQLGTPNDDKADYWSDSGQVAYLPDGSMADDPGLMATRHFAYYQGVFATAPLPDVSRGIPNPDPSTRKADYLSANGGEPLHGVVTQVRSTNTTGNDAFVLWENGLITVASTQTGHGKIGLPWLRLPEEKQVQDLAVTSNNELLLVALYDAKLRRGQLAVIMVEGKGIPVHTFTQMGLPNQASVSAMKLLGYVDLPVATTLRVAAACNGTWGGPSATGGKTLGRMDLTNAETLQNLESGSWAGVVANAGYAVVVSREESQLAVVDLTPVFKYIRQSWLSSIESFNATTASRGEAAAQWPNTFSVRPEISPRVVLTKAIERPVSVICGHRVDRWSSDRFKFHVGLEAGELSIWDASPIMARAKWHRKGNEIHELGRMKVGENPISLAFARRGEGQGSALIPAGSKQKGDGQNNVLWIACRKARQVIEVLTLDGKGTVLRTIEDQKLQDPVNVCTAVRGYIVLVCDFRGKQVMGFRVGTITDARAKPKKVYPPTEGPNGEDWEVSGVLPVPGYPHTITSENVN